MSVTNSLTPNTALTQDQLVSTDRPVIVDFNYSGSGDVPLVCEVRCKAFIGGIETYIGDALYANRQPSSTPSNPKFKLDFSEIMSKAIGDTFKKSYEGVVQFPNNTDSNRVVNQLNSAARPESEGMTACSFEAVAWCQNPETQVLERSGEDPVIWSTYKVNPVKIILPPSHVNLAYDEVTTGSISYSNIKNQNSSSLATLDGVIHGYVSDHAENGLFPTNCPRSLVRRIPTKHPISLALITHERNDGLNITVKVKAFVTSQNSFEDVATSLQIPAGNGETSNFLTYIAKADAFPLLLPNASTFSDIKDGYFETVIDLYDAPSFTEIADTLKFKALSTSSNSNLDSVKARAKTLYWINDFNVLDFYHFEGGTTITYESETNTYVRNKDYTSRRNSNKSVLEGSTTEIVKVRSSLGNFELLKWLIEIGRSNRVFEFDGKTISFIPILVKDIKEVVLSPNQDAYSVEIEYVKDTIHTR